MGQLHFHCGVLQNGFSWLNFVTQLLLLMHHCHELPPLILFAKPQTSPHWSHFTFFQQGQRSKWAKRVSQFMTQCSLWDIHTEFTTCFHFAMLHREFLYDWYVHCTKESIETKLQRNIWAKPAELESLASNFSQMDAWWDLKLGEAIMKTLAPDPKFTHLLEHAKTTSSPFLFSFSRHPPPSLLRWLGPAPQKHSSRSSSCSCSS